MGKATATRYRPWRLTAGEHDARLCAVRTATVMCSRMLCFAFRSISDQTSDWVFRHVRNTQELSHPVHRTAPSTLQRCLLLAAWACVRSDAGVDQQYAMRTSWLPRNRPCLPAQMLSPTRATLSTWQARALRAAKRTTCRARPISVTALAHSQPKSSPCTNITWHEGSVKRRDKERLLDQKGCVLWFTGLSASGKSTVACTLEHALNKRGHLTTLLDGDNLRHGLNCNLGFSSEDRAENIRRIGEVSKLLVDSGLITLASFISPYRQDRDKVRSRLQPGDFIEVYMKTPLSVCESRDPKGLYKLARAGKIKGFTGIDDPYEPPVNAEVVLETDRLSVEAMAAELLIFLDSRGFLSNVPQVRAAQYVPCELDYTI